MFWQIPQYLFVRHTFCISFCNIFPKTGNRTRHAMFIVSPAVFNFVTLIQLPKFLAEICTVPLVFLPFFFCGSCGCRGWSRTNTSDLLLTQSVSSILWWESSNLTLANQKWIVFPACDRRPRVGPTSGVQVSLETSPRSCKSQINDCNVTTLSKLSMLAKCSGKPLRSRSTSVMLVAQKLIQRPSALARTSSASWERGEDIDERCRVIGILS